MERIQKYKIEDESLDDQTDNYIYSQNSFSNNPPPKNMINSQSKAQPKTITVSQPKIQISDLNIKDKEKQKNKILNNNPNIPSEIKEDIIPTNSNNNFEEEINLTNENESLNNNNNNNIEINDNGYHHVQIIDEDVENFKRRLDIMVKNFRTDTLKDFMAIKRNLLIEQKTCIENEKQKCEALLSSKGDLIEHLKDDLAKTQKALNNQIIIKEKLVEILFKKNHDKILKKYKSLAFHNVLMKYHLKKKSKKDKIKTCRKNYWDNYKKIFFRNLKQNWRDMKIYKIVSVKEKACDDKLNEMAQKYGKEINDLRNKLNDANLLIEQNNQAKNQIQENLKKVLMRGVMAMNMEAMNVLDKDVIQNNDISAIADNIMNNVNINDNNNINNLNNNNPTNIKVGLNEDKNMIATVIPANQSFQPGSLNNNNKNSPLVMNNMNNPSPINKDSFWINAPSVPMDIQKNLITTDNKFNREAMIMTMNNNNNNNNNIFNNIETNTQNNQMNNINDFEEDELNSRVYNLSPMNPIDTKYINSNHSLNEVNNLIPQYNNMNNINDINNKNNELYYDEMKQNILGIKNEFSMIKQNQSSMMDDESINSFGMSKNIPNNNFINNNKISYYNTSNTNNTSKNNNRANSKKGNNLNNNKKSLKNNNNSVNANNNKVPKNSKKAPSNTIKNKK